MTERRRSSENVVKTGSPLGLGARRDRGQLQRAWAGLKNFNPKLAAGMLHRRALGPCCSTLANHA